MVKFVIIYDMKVDERKRLARSKDTPPEVLSVLANDPRSWRVRRAVALNKNTPIKTLKGLLLDRDNRVVIAARRALEKRRNEYVDESEGKEVRT